ncbi:MAG: hypothetical protein LQ338_000787 [Usnochroma carphineum]|nr:MAG: hypothetical protein LQ338_000787 [Usnochroma carphineum]
MCWPRLEGGIEIEERYPRTNDPREPRRRRLNFVRDRSSSRTSSDDYALMHSSFYQARPIRAEMREQHDPQVLQQQQMHMRQLQGQNQELRNHLVLEARRRFELEQAQHPGHSPPPPPPPPGTIGPGPQQRRIEPVEPHPQPQIVEVQPRPRSRVPHHVHRGRSPSRDRGHRRHHSGASIYSDDRYSDRDHDHRRRGRSPIVYGSIHDSFDDLMSEHHPHVRRDNPWRRL